MERRNGQDRARVYLAEERGRGGRIRYRITVCEYVGGARVRTSLTTSCESEARALHRAELARAEGVAAMSVGELLDRYRQAHECQRSPRTIKRQAQHASALLDAHELVAHVDVALAESWYARLAESGVAAATHRDARQFASRVWQWGCDEGLVKSNPWRRVAPRGKVRAGKAQLRLGEAQALAEVALADAHPSALVALLALLCGLRLGEILALSARDVEPAHGLVWVAESGGKTAHARRTQTMPEALSRRLARVLATLDGSTPIFALNPSTALRGVRRLCELAGVPAVSVHGLRGTYTSLSLLPGGGGSGGGSALAEIAARLGHGGTSGTRVAEQHYADPAVLASVRQRAVCAALGVE